MWQASRATTTHTIHRVAAPTAQTLQFANVETFIVFRAATPLFISLADYAVMGRELPSCRSASCLLLLVCGAVAYTLNDAHFEVRGYAWVGVWFAIFCFDQLYIKHAVDATAVDSNLGARPLPSRAETR